MLYLVLILPMRNGNSFFSNSLLIFLFLFLSYLWGMETLPFYQTISMSYLSSYPTYEEWKLFCSKVSKFLFLRSYPTYEEWKHCNTENSLWKFGMFLSYLWGMETPESISINGSPSSFLSYLWGMETMRFIDDLLFFIIVLILPMRNGNVKSNEFDDIVGDVLILPMRNGNEIQVITSYITLKFLSYLWGMETKKYKEE